MVSSAPDDLVGRTIDGRYEVRARLARGGMATVYEAVDLRLDRVVALKVMHRHLADDPDFVARFQREARAAARLTHPHVVGVYDQGSAEGLIYLAMEYVPGRTLRDVLRQFGPLSPEQALVILDPVLEGLAAAHAAGFVHRDIKPENVLISDDGRVKVADFGLARAVETSNASATQGMIIGTVAYLSPEQVQRGEADERSDVYAAGILLFEMVTGTVPHAGETPLSVAYQHVNADVPAPSTVRGGIPADVDALVVTATRRDPALRYGGATDFLADVRRVRGVLPPPRPFTDTRDTLVVDATTAARLNAGAPRTPAPPPSAAPSPAAPAPIRTRRRRWPWVAAIVAVIVALAAFGGWYLATMRTVPTPDVVGRSVAEAREALAGAGLTLEVASEEFSETVPRDLVISSDPAPGDGAREGGAVAVIVSKGPERYAVPDVSGQSPQQASAAISAAGLVPGATEQAFDNAAPSGSVVRTEPEAGAQVKKGTSVAIIVSKGPKPIELPDLVGRKIAKAEATLADLGLTAAITSTFSEEVPKNEVIAQTPSPGTVVNSGSAVALTVSKGPPPVTVPNLVDMPRAKAVSTLKRLGLKAKVVAGAATPLNRVYSQDPAPGTEIPKGSTVTIRII